MPPVVVTLLPGIAAITILAFDLLLLRHFSENTGAYPTGMLLTQRAWTTLTGTVAISMLQEQSKLKATEMTLLGVVDEIVEVQHQTSCQYEWGRDKVWVQSWQST